MVKFIAQFILALLILAAISTVHASGLEGRLSRLVLVTPPGYKVAARHSPGKEAPPLNLRGIPVPGGRRDVVPYPVVAYQWFKTPGRADNRPTRFQRHNSDVRNELVVDGVDVSSL